MSNLFRGMIFIFLSFTFTFGNSKLDILPDFIGFIMIVKGLDELYNQSDNFIKVKPIAIGLGVYTLILFILDLLGVTSGLGYIAIILGLVYTVFLIYVTYTIIIGIIDIEKNLNASLNTEKLMSNWKLMILFNVLAYLTLFAPGIAFICLIINIVFIILYLISFNTTKNLYYENN